MTTTETNSFYVTGGTLRRDAACYVQRRADQALYDGLMQSNFCYVLTSRQMGKSSLMVRTAARLREDGVHVAVLDLTSIGQNLNAEQWYDGLLARLEQQFQLEDELEDFWLNHARLSPLLRWMKAIREVVLPRLAGRIIVFVDEIDAVRSLPFSTDEFFAAIRELYNRRTEDAELERLTFCLLGVASPSDLIRDTRTTPFNIGQRIELNDFSDNEAEPLSQGLGREDKIAAKLLKRILYWTGGHPYLTQRLCQATAADANVHDVAGIDRLCEELFFTTRARERDDNLLFVRERMLKSEADRAALLDLYKKLRDNKRVKDDETNPLVSVLRLSGITRVVEGLLYVRNRIYYRVFDREWVLANLPDAEMQRQRAAYWRGLWRAAAVAAVIVVALGALSFVAVRQRNRAVESEQTNRRLLYAAQMNLAGQDWEAGNYGRVRDLLNTYIPTNNQEDLRSFEWFYLWRAHGKDFAMLKMPTLNGASISHDRKTLAFLEAGTGSILLWDIGTWKQLHALRYQNDLPFATFSPDDRRLYSLGVDRKLKTWDVITGQEQRTVELEEDFQFMVGLPDGKQLALSTPSGKVSFLDAETGKERVSFQAHKDNGASFVRLIFTPDGKYMVSAGLDDFVKVWEVKTLKEIRLFKVRSGYGHYISLSQDGTKLAIGGEFVKLFELPSGKEIVSIENLHTQPAYYHTVVFSPDGTLLAADDSNNSVQVWETKTGKEKYIFKKSNGAGQVAFLPDERGLLSIRDSELQMWKLVPEESAVPDVIKDYNKSIICVSWSPDGKSFAAGDDGGAIIIRDSSTGKDLAALRNPNSSEEIWNISFSADGQRIVSVDRRKTISVWDIKSRNLLRSFKTTDYASGLPQSISSDTNRVAIADNKGTVKVWDVNLGKEVLTINAWFISRTAFSPDGRILALTEYESGNIRLVDSLSGKELSVLKGQLRPWSVGFSPDSETMATGSMTGNISLWEVKTGRQISTTTGHAQGVNNLSFSPDGKRLATGGFDKKVKIWDAHTGQELLTLTGHTHNLQAVAFSPDGKTLLSAGEDKTIRIWRAATDADVQARRGQ